MVKIKFRMFSQENPKVTIGTKQVPRHTNLGKRTRMKAQADEQVGGGSWEEAQDECWLWHYLGNFSLLSHVTLLIVLLLKNQFKSQVKGSLLLASGCGWCPVLLHQIGSGKRAPTCIDGARGRRPRQGLLLRDSLLNQFLGLEEAPQVEDLPRGQPDEAEHGEDAEVQDPGVRRLVGVPHLLFSLLHVSKIINNGFRKVFQASQLYL